MRWASHCAPRSSSYWDIWLDGEKIEIASAGRASRRFPRPATIRSSRSTARPTCRASSRRPSRLPEDNCTDIHANDLGFLAIVEDGRLVGYNVLVGGGLGTTPSAQKTFPFLARAALLRRPRPTCSKIGEAVLKVFRDFGNRSDRKRARLKYIIHDWGMPAFRAKVEEYLGHPLADPKPVTVTDVDDHLGWHAQGDGKLFLGIPVENGRIKDEGDYPAGQRPAGLLREVPDARPADLPAVDPAGGPRAGLAARDRGAGWRNTGSPRSSRSRPCGAGRWPARPCRPAAWPSPRPSAPCRRSSTSSRSSSTRLGLEDERFTVRMTGCPNGCARPYNSDIGLVGRSAHINPDGTPGTGHVHDLPGRPDRRRPAQHRVQGLRPLRPGRRRAGAGLRPLQGRAPRRRVVRRFLRSGRRRRAGPLAVARAEPGRLSTAVRSRRERARWTISEPVYAELIAAAARRRRRRLIAPTAASASGRPC